MTDRRDDSDPFEILARANPVPPGTYAEAGRSPHAHLLFERIVAGRALRPPWWRRRRLLIPLVFTLAAAGAAAGYALSLPVTPVVECFSGPSLSSSSLGVGTDQASASQECAADWSHGAFGGPTGPGSVPPLQSCLLTSGIVGVFPSDDPDLCAHLGLSNAPGTGGGSVAELQQDLATIYESTACLDPTTAATDVQQTLNSLGLTDWQVVPGTGFSSAQPCASFAVDPAAQTVSVVPLPTQQ